MKTNKKLLITFPCEDWDNGDVINIDRDNNGYITVGTTFSTLDRGYHEVLENIKDKYVVLELNNLGEYRLFKDHVIPKFYNDEDLKPYYELEMVHDYLYPTFPTIPSKDDYPAVHLELKCDETFVELIKEKINKAKIGSEDYIESMRLDIKTLIDDKAMIEDRLKKLIESYADCLKELGHEYAFKTLMDERDDLVTAEKAITGSILSLTRGKKE